MRCGRQPEEDILRARTVVFSRFLYQASLMEKRYLVMQMRSCEDKLKGKTVHFRFPSASQKRACLSSLMFIYCNHQTVATSFLKPSVAKRNLKHGRKLGLFVTQFAQALRAQALTCAHFGRDQICKQVDTTFSPFGHPTQVNRSLVKSIRCCSNLIANETQDT